MAKLKSHGAELLRVENIDYRLSYRANGKILRDAGGGWKLFRTVNPGVDIIAHAARKREFYNGKPTPDRLHRAAFRRALVAEFPQLEARIRAFITIESMQTIVDLCRLYKAARDEGLAVRNAKQNAANLFVKRKPNRINPFMQPRK